MPVILTDLNRDAIPLVRLESDRLCVDVAPSVGGRVVSLVDRRSGHEFLWRNQSLSLARLAPGSEYDPAFYGGIDELLPNDIPETLHGLACPDHGELWTTALDYHVDGNCLRLSGKLPIFGLAYEREMTLHPDLPVLESTYRITNVAAEPRSFLWKLHAAIAVQPGDVIECPADRGQVVDLAWSRFQTLAPFPWPTIEGQAANVIPPPDGSMDFFFLSELHAGRVAWRRPDADLMCAYQFDRTTFPFVWLFSSYGGFNHHYTAILEPCTAMPLSVREAAVLQQCSRLNPGEVLETKVQLWAGQGSEIEPYLMA